MKSIHDIDFSKCATNQFRGFKTRTVIDSDGDPCVMFSGFGGKIAFRDTAHGGWRYQIYPMDSEIDELREIFRQVDSFIEFELRKLSTPAVKLPVKTKAPPGSEWQYNHDGQVVLRVHESYGDVDVDMPVNTTYRDAYLACAEAYGEVFGGQVVRDILVLDTSYHRCCPSSFQAQISDTIPSKGPAKVILNAR